VTEASLELARLMHQHNNDTKGAVKVCSKSGSPRATSFFFLLLLLLLLLLLQLTTTAK